MRSITTFLASALVLLSLLPGCGFRLAGSADPSGLQNVSVHGMSSSRELVHLVRESLRSGEVNVVEPDHAAIRLDIVSEETAREVLSLDASGKAREYDLMLDVSFEVRHAQHSDSPARQKIRIHRVLVFDKHDVLGSAEEEDLLLREMRREAAQRIVRRLAAIPLD